MLRIQEIGAIAYGGAVTLTTWWDNKRIDEGKIAKKAVFKKASFYTYLGVGLIATLMSVFGWMRRWEAWTEKLSTGFFYGLPGFAYDLSKSLTAAGRGRGSESAAVREAQKVLERRQLAEAKSTERSYEKEFESVAPHAF